MDFELQVVQGRSTTTTLKLGDGVTTIGRLDECQLRIKSSQVSRRHCELFEKKGLLLVKDLGSSNGTLVNGQRIEGQRVLEPGDELTIGPVQLRVAKSGATAASAPTKPGSSPGDTAVSAPIAMAGETDDFTIDFDEPTQAPETAAVPAAAPASGSPSKAKVPAQDEDAIADFLMDLPIDEDENEVPTTPAPPTAPASQVGAAKGDAGSKAEHKEPGKAKEPAASDDAIADFLLDIKLDDEE